MSTQVHDLPQPFGAILEAMQAAENLSAARHRRVEQLADAIKELHDENGELRDAILALSNRLESATRRFAALTDAQRHVNRVLGGLE